MCSIVTITIAILALFNRNFWAKKNYKNDALRKIALKLSIMVFFTSNECLTAQSSMISSNFVCTIYVLTKTATKILPLEPGIQSCQCKCISLPVNRVVIYHNTLNHNNRGTELKICDNQNVGSSSQL